MKIKGYQKKDNQRSKSNTTIVLVQIVKYTSFNNTSGLLSFSKTKTDLLVPKRAYNNMDCPLWYHSSSFIVVVAIFKKLVAMGLNSHTTPPPTFVLCRFGFLIFNFTTTTTRYVCDHLLGCVVCRLAPWRPENHEQRGSKELWGHAHPTRPPTYQAGLERLRRLCQFRGVQVSILWRIHTYKSQCASPYPPPSPFDCKVHFISDILALWIIACSVC